MTGRYETMLYFWVAVSNLPLHNYVHDHKTNSDDASDGPLHNMHHALAIVVYPHSWSKIAVRWAKSTASPSPPLLGALAFLVRLIVLFDRKQGAVIIMIHANAMCRPVHNYSCGINVTTTENNESESNALVAH